MLKFSNVIRSTFYETLKISIVLANIFELFESVSVNILFWLLMTSSNLFFVVERNTKICNLISLLRFSFYNILLVNRYLKVVEADFTKTSQGQ
jgi:hypothetical protein